MYQASKLSGRNLLESYQKTFNARLAFTPSREIAIVISMHLRTEELPTSPV